MTTITPKCTCPGCGYKFDHATGVRLGDDMPEEGSISICLRCAEVQVYNADLTVRALTAAELIDLQRSAVWPTIERARAAVKRLRGVQQ